MEEIEENVRVCKVRIPSVVIRCESGLDSCASRLRPKNTMKIFPATMGAIDRYPQFSEK